MSLKSFEKEMSKTGAAQAKAIIDEAEAEAKQILSEAESSAKAIVADATGRAEREAEQIAKEIVASARQTNQKNLLIARREALDKTFEAVKASLSDAGWSGRASLLKSLMQKADELTDATYSVNPVSVDQSAVSELAGSRTIGDSIEGLGGFTLEAADGSVSYDMRFETLLDQVWASKLSEINSLLFA